jgi:hypothetical protein
MADDQMSGQERGLQPTNSLERMKFQFNNSSMASDMDKVLRMGLPRMQSTKNRNGILGHLGGHTSQNALQRFGT